MLRVSRLDKPSRAPRRVTSLTSERESCLSFGNFPSAAKFNSPLPPRSVRLVAAGVFSPARKALGISTRVALGNVSASAFS
ncbi:hypothetical protein D3C74_395620 [compost metagenome]